LNTSTAFTIHEADTQHWGATALTLLNERWLKPAFALAQRRDRSNMISANNAAATMIHRSRRIDFIFQL
jgi:hypothetical protein